MNPSDPSDDATLARLAKGGSTDAFGLLVRRHHPQVFAFLLALTRHRQDAEDLTQETFVRAWNKIHRYDPGLPLRPWLFTIARRLSISAMRRARPVAGIPEPSSPEHSNRALWLWEMAKNHLTPDAYGALWLHYREELPLKEIATVLGKREGAVKVMLHRARKSLAEKIHGSRSVDVTDTLPEPQRMLP